MPVLAAVTQLSMVIGQQPDARLPISHRPHRTNRADNRNEQAELNAGGSERSRFQLPASAAHDLCVLAATYYAKSYLSCV